MRDRETLCGQIKLCSQATGRHWWTIAGGTAMGLLCLIAAILKWAPPTIIWASGLFLFFGIIGALFLAWRDEHVQLVKEEAKNSVPHFTGDLENIRLIPIKSAKQPEEGVYVAFELRLHNDSNTPSSIRELVATIANRDDDVVHRVEPYWQPSGRRCPDGKVYKRGEEQVMSLELHLDNVSAKRINKKSLKIQVRDAFGIDHFIAQTRQSASGTA